MPRELTPDGHAKLEEAIDLLGRALTLSSGEARSVWLLPATSLVINGAGIRTR